ncbi:MAG: hypothetical protein V4526_00390 [Patescibacteria group bacterium]
MNKKLLIIYLVIAVIAVAGGVAALVKSPANDLPYEAPIAQSTTTTGVVVSPDKSVPVVAPTSTSVTTKTSVVVKSKPVSSSPLTVVSPNGGEIWKFRSDQEVRWARTTDESANLVVYLSGPTSGVLKTFTVTGKEGVIPVYVGNIMAGDVQTPIKPGKYKIHIVAHRGQPCYGGSCTAEEKANNGITADDWSDAEFTIQ